jgi:membrane protease YdiL (CAAX protease family)
MRGRSESLDLERYWSASRSVPVAVLLVAPLWLAYEVALRLVDSDLRNAAEQSVKTVLWWLGPGSAAVRAFVLAVIAWAAIDVVRRRVPIYRLFAPFLVECVLLATLLGPAVAFLLQTFQLASAAAPMPPDASLPVALLLSVGAGLYEEFVFRLVLLGGLFALLVRAFGATRPFALVVALAVSSVAFAAYHHAGPFGEPFTPRAFWFRLAAGIVLGLIFALRGLAVVVYLHAVYDVLHDLRAAVWMDGT